MSPPEVLLWTRLRLLRGEGPTFRRQHPIGPYIADFYCAAAQLVVEVDGANHTEDGQIARDAARTAYLARLGCHVVRVPAGDVLGKVDDAAQGIVQAAIYWIEQRSGGHTPPPSRRASRAAPPPPLRGAGEG